MHKNDFTEKFHKLSSQLLMTVVLLNIIYFNAFSALHFRSNRLTHIPSLIVFCFPPIVTIYTLITFYLDSSPFDYFVYSFKLTRLATLHCFIYILTLISATVLLVLIPQYSFAAAGPILLLLGYTIFYRPYKILS